MSLKRQRTRQKIPFPNSKNLGGGSSKKICKGFFWRGAARLAVLGGGVELRHFPQNQF